MSLQELERAVETLPVSDFQEFSTWFDQWRAEQWDRQIEQDAQSGRLDTFYQKLQRENEGQPDIPLNEVLDEEKLS